MAGAGFKYRGSSAWILGRIERAAYARPGTSDEGTMQLESTAYASQSKEGVLSIDSGQSSITTAVAFRQSGELPKTYAIPVLPNAAAFSTAPIRTNWRCRSLPRSSLS